MIRKKISMDVLSRRPHRSASKKRARRITVLAICVLLTLLVTVSVILVVRLGEYRAAREEYATYQQMDVEADALAEAAAPEATPLPLEVVESAPLATARPYTSYRVAELKKTNRDAVGWLEIPDTDMCYPVVQGKDNDYYMNHTFTKRRNASGAIFLDCWNVADFTDFNTVIYGHNMKDGSMFAGLREYSSQKFFDAHDTIEITLLNKKLRYRVFAAYVAQDEQGADFRGQSCTTGEQRAAFIKAVRKRSTDVASNAAVSRNDRLLTLVTCTGGTHPWFWVVHAALVGEEV